MALNEISYSLLAIALSELYLLVSFWKHRFK